MGNFRKPTEFKRQSNEPTKEDHGAANGQCAHQGCCGLGTISHSIRGGGPFYCGRHMREHRYARPTTPEELSREIIKRKLRNCAIAFTTAEYERMANGEPLLEMVVEGVMAGRIALADRLAGIITTDPSGLQ